MMLNLLISFFLAAVVGITASSIYGAEHMSQHAWVEHLIWAIIIAGVASEGLCAIVSSHLCGKAKWLRLMVCHSARCKQA